MWNRRMTVMCIRKRPNPKSVEHSLHSGLILKASRSRSFRTAFQPLSSPDFPTRTSTSLLVLAGEPVIGADVDPSYATIVS
jgi:hypothetical protein